MSEFRLISRHAGAVLAGQLAVMAFGVVDTVVAGRHSDAALATLSVGTAIYLSIFVALMGLVQALLPIWAEHRGAGRPLQLGYAWRQSMYLAAFIMVLGIALLLSPRALMRWTDVPAEIQSGVSQYLSILALALPPAALFRMYGTLNQSLGKPKLLTWLQLFSLALKVPLTVWFAFGGLGLEGHGAAGCAWATVAVNYVMLIMSFWLLRTRSLYQPYAIWRPMERPNWPLIADYLRLGVPGALAILVEVTSFTLMALFIARMGTVSAASHQIAASSTAVLYMMPLSIGIATSSRIGFWLGAANADQARAALKAGFTLAVGVALTLSTLLYASRAWVAALYSNQQAVATVAASLLGWVAIYHLADALQALSVFVLRCYRVTLAPLVIYGVWLWGVGLLGGYLLAYHGLGAWQAQGTPDAFWIAGAVALAATALCLGVLLLRVLSRSARTG